MSYTESYKISKISMRALTVLTGFIGSAGIYWSFHSGQPAGVTLFFLAATCIAPFIYVTHKRYMDKHLREQEDAAVYQELLNQVNDSILVMEASEPYRIMEANRTACQRLGYGREELLRLTAGDITDLGDTLELLRGRANAAGLPDAEYQEIQYITADQKTVPVEVHVRLIRLQGRRALLAIARDVSERKRMENRIRHMAYYDDLTGLPNRRLFQERLGYAMRETAPGRGLAVLYLDIDRFKLINDSFGHDYGDMLLMQVAERFTHCVGEYDFLARTEGDEFALYLTDVGGPDRLGDLAGRINEVLEEPFSVGEYQIHITASIGISYYDGSEEAPENVMKQADIALSYAKEKGKNSCQIFNQAMNAVSLTRLTMESELRRAIHRGEFILEYQPQLDTGSGSIVGMEALLRWKHPERGRVSPQEFIPIAEDTGLIVPIGDWVLLEACRQNKAWQEEGRKLVPVSVNLSMRQFQQPNLKDRIQAILDETRLPPEALELEITESMTMDVEFAAGVLKQLKELGVKISIDDFGTGYSSLYFLKKFPIDRLKIDRSFVRDIMVDPNDAAIVATIISMTRHLNLKVIAEGVETVEQLEFLHRNRCNEVQGYWFSPPVPAYRMSEFMSLNEGKLPGGGMMPA